MRLKIAIFIIIFILSAFIISFFSENLLRSFIIYAICISVVIAVFEAIFKNEILLLFTNAKTVKENFYIILERFFKIFIPIFLMLNISITIFIQLKPNYFISEKSLFHHEIIVFMTLLFVFSIYSIANLDFRRNQLRAYEKQIWIANNMIVRESYQHYEKVERILEICFELISPKSPMVRRKSIWILMPDYDTERKINSFSKVHFKCLDSDIGVYAKLVKGYVPFMNVDEWIKACDALYEAIKGVRNKKFIESEYQIFRKIRNEFASVAGYVYLRNFEVPLISKIDEGNCLVYNDEYLSLYDNESERKKYQWRSMMVWPIIYARKKVAILFFLDTEKYGFRPAHRLIMKNLANTLGPVIYDGIKNKYYGDAALEMLTKAPNIDSEDIVIQKLGNRYKSPEWKKEIEEIQRLCKYMHRFNGGY